MSTAKRLQSLQNAFVRHIAQVQQSSDGRTERLQLGQSLIGVGLLRFHARQLLANTLLGMESDR